MSLHRFAVNVPNPAARPVSVELRLERVKRDALAWLRHEGARRPLEVTHSGITRDPCSTLGKRKLTMTLDPFTSVDVYVVVRTARSRRPAVAAFQLIDRRRGKVGGGVVLVCTDPPFAEPPGQLVPAANPCPIVMAKTIYAIRPGEDPAKSAAQPIVGGQSVELVAPVTNPTAAPLKDVQVYLEHLGSSNAGFSPGTWKAGSMKRGAVFYATWNVHPSAWQLGTFDASVVVASEGTDPVRLRGSFTISSPTLETSTEMAARH